MLVRTDVVMIGETAFITCTTEETASGTSILHTNDPEAAVQFTMNWLCLHESARETVRSYLERKIKAQSEHKP